MRRARTVAVLALGLWASGVGPAFAQDSTVIANRAIPTLHHHHAHHGHHGLHGGNWYSHRSHWRGGHWHGPWWSDRHSSLSFHSGGPGYSFDLYDGPIGVPVTAFDPYAFDAGIASLGPLVLPPLYVPAEELGFGPQGLARFLGQPPLAAAPRRAANVVVLPPEADVVKKRAGRVSNAEARARAQQFIDFGDAQFTARNKAGAYERYKKASEAAPDLAEPHFRIGHTQVDMERFAAAATSFRRGLDLQPDWPAQGFRFEQMYGDNRAAQELMLDSVQKTAEQSPNDRDIQFVAGVQFFFAGRRDQAQRFFDRAAELGEEDRYVRQFWQAMGVNRPLPEAAAERDI